MAGKNVYLDGGEEGGQRGLPGLNEPLVARANLRVLRTLHGLRNIST